CRKFDKGWGIHPDDFGEFNPLFLGNCIPLLLGILQPMLTQNSTKEKARPFDSRCRSQRTVTDIA
ncbi:hypothetical protein, partial [Alicyclobacillus suci]|uniref:hypothetical protein n=1 Tax=Alicyclobacillus suci TaxID=2816080 RepID=UPI001A8FB5B2